jgi:transposase
MGELFDDLPEQRREGSAAVGAARLRKPIRNEVKLEICDLDALIDEDHPARLIWAYAEKVDLSEIEASIKVRLGTPGMPQTSPHLLLALWLYATSDGVGSARELARLCESMPAYRWLCGGVGINHHGLSDFRSLQGARIEALLTQHVASLSVAGLIDLDEVAQDGVRVRANAGASSFRRRKTLEAELSKAQELLARLAQEKDDDPGASGRRRKARQESAARDRAARVEEALVVLGQVEKLREKRLKTNKAETKRQKEPRASTTDPAVRVLKMPDGGFRPGYNVQFASLPESGIVISVDCGTVGSDRGLAEPMAAAIEKAYDRRPKRHLVDGGYQSAKDIGAAAAKGTAIYSPPIKSKSGKDPYEPRAKDSKAVAEWRARMATEEAQVIYRRRARAELVHAKLRNLYLDRLYVRGLEKVKTWMRWFALSMNILTEARLRKPQIA